MVCLREIALENKRLEKLSLNQSSFNLNTQPQLRERRLRMFDSYSHYNY
jgi:hypothetical protein